MRRTTDKHKQYVAVLAMAEMIHYMLSHSEVTSFKFVALTSTSVFGDGRISTHADPTPTRREISRFH